MAIVSRRVFWDSKGGWATRLKCYFDAMMAKAPGFPDHDFYYMVFPLGIGDETTRNILERFEFETEKRMIWKTTEEIFIFAIGSNDSTLLTSDEFERNVREIIKRARRFSNKIVFLDISPVNEELTMPVPWDDTFFSDNKSIEKFNNILFKITQEESVGFVSLYDDWKATDYTKLLADGMHPNDAGHEDIFNRVKDFIQKNYL